MFDAVEIVSRNSLVRCTPIRPCVARGDGLMLSKEPLEQVLSFYDRFLYGFLGGVHGSSIAAGRYRK